MLEHDKHGAEQLLSDYVITIMLQVGWCSFTDCELVRVTQMVSRSKYQTALLAHSLELIL